LLNISLGNPNGEASSIPRLKFEMKVEKQKTKRGKEAKIYEE
jgi:hypothetical protein